MAVILNPRWGNEAKNCVIVTIDDVNTSINRNDPSDTLRTLFDAITAGDHGAVGEYVPAPPVIFDPASMPRVETPIPVFEERPAETLGDIYVLPAPRVPEEISDRQFFQGLALRNMITQQEALDAVMVGALPAVMAGFIAQLPEAERFSARMILSGATTYHRSNPLTAAFGAMAGMDAAALDEFWSFCAGL